MLQLSLEEVVRPKGGISDYTLAGNAVEQLTVSTEYPRVSLHQIPSKS